MKSMSRDADAYIKSFMALCSEHGVKPVVRVLREPVEDFGFKLMSYFRYGNDVPMVSCPDLEEALKLLDGK